MSGRSLAFDTETSGVDTTADRIVTACAAILDELGQVAFQRQWLVKVDVDIPEAATAIHGVTTEHAREHGSPASEVIPEVANAIRWAVHSQVPVVGHNVVFDLSILDAECRRNGLGSLEDFVGLPIYPVVDTLCVDKAVDRYRPGSRKLVDVAAHYGVRLDGAHDAAADAVAAGLVAWAIARRTRLPADELYGLYADRKFPDRLVRDWHALGRMSLGDLHRAQVRWATEQAASFAQYLRTQGNQKVHDAERAAEAFDDEAATIARQEAAELFARADVADPPKDVPVWPVLSAKEGAVA